MRSECLDLADSKHPHPSYGHLLPPQKTRREKGKAFCGFTLLEVLIALFIFTIVSIIMVSGLRTVLNSQSVTEKQANHLSELQMALLLVSRDFEQAINRPITNAKGAIDSALIGTPRNVAFTHAGLANPLGQLQRSTLQRTQYELDKQNFIRETWPVLDQVPKTPSSQRILLDYVTDVRFEYLDYQGRFQNNWPPPESTQANLPRAIRISLTLQNWGKISQLYLLPAAGQDIVKPSN